MRWCWLHQSGAGPINPEMTKVPMAPDDPATRLRTEEEMFAYLDAALMVAWDDPGLVAYALDMIQRARKAAKSDPVKSDTIPPMEGWQSG
jgi:hypothetical protein